MTYLRQLIGSDFYHFYWKLILHADTSHLQGEFVPADLLDVSSQCFDWSLTGSVAPDRHSPL